jgi:transposase
MSQKNTYFRFTTVQQRKLLFEKWEATGSVTQACRAAHVGRATFYYWKHRFDEKGYAGLEEFESRVPHKVNRKEGAIAQRVVEMRQQHLDWGKTRIANELAKQNNWVAVVSPNTVRRILQEAHLWPEQAGSGRKKRGDARPTEQQNKPERP